MDNAEDDDLGVGMIDAEMSSPIPEDAFSDIVDVDMGDGGHDDATPGDDVVPALVTDEDEDGIEVVYVSQSRLFMYLNEYMKR